jgi:hypothetical protein
MTKSNARVWSKEPSLTLARLQIYRLSDVSRLILIAAAFLAIVCAGQTSSAGDAAGSEIVLNPDVATYEDSRPAPRYRLNARDQGVILRHGGGEEFDARGARDVWAFRTCSPHERAKGPERGHQADGSCGKQSETYFLHYDAAGPDGWLTSQAISTDLQTFVKKGPLLKPGPPGALDSASASYGTTYFDGQVWRMYYLGTQTASPKPDLVPMGPYYTLEAKAKRPEGPWIKQAGVVLTPEKGTYYDLTVSPGYIVKSGGRYLQFFSAGKRKQIGVGRTIGIARAESLDGPWTIDSNPIVPLDEQIENSSLYFQSTTRTWFMFVNHVALLDHQEFTDAIWVYWTQDLEHWNKDDKAVVLDAANCGWSKDAVGLPSVLPVGGRLAIFYDGLDATAKTSHSEAQSPDAYRHMFRDIGLAWLDLPIRLPSQGSVASPGR